jgi:Ca2+-binding RTX toxin-like protein
MRVLAVVVVVLATSAPAQAGRVSAGYDPQAGRAVIFSPGSGEQNTVTVTALGSQITVTDSTAPIVAVGPECTPSGPTSVVCGEPDRATVAVVVRLGDGDDSVSMRASLTRSGRREFGVYFAVLDGGLGADSLSLDPSRAASMIDGGPGNDVIVGGRAVDEVTGGRGDDVVSGGRGNDRIDEGGGNDRIDGGLGRDEVSYFHAVRAVAASLVTGVARGAGTDRLRRVEDLTGSRFADRFVGNGDPNFLCGWRGNDVIVGNGGNDHLGQDGCELGDDRLYGGPGNDTLFSGEGDDLLDGGPGDDYARGGPGDDLLRFRDGTSDRKVDGGGGSDRAAVDAADRLVLRVEARL